MVGIRVRRFKELGNWYITRNAINGYKENVIDDPILKRGCIALDIERRIRSAVNKIENFDELPTLDNTIFYKTMFTGKGQFYYVLIKLSERSKRPIVAIWTDDIYQNYMNGITSDGHSIYEHMSSKRKNDK